MKNKSPTLGISFFLASLALSVLLVGGCNLIRVHPPPPPTMVVVYVDVTATPTRPVPTSKIPAATPTRGRPDLALTIRAPQMLQGSGNEIPEKREVSDFDRVYLTSFGDLFIAQGEQESLTMVADDNLMPHITTDVENGTLILNSPFPDGSVEFYLRVKEITELGATGVGDIIWRDLDTERLELVLTGAGDIIGSSLNTKRLHIFLDGAGDVDIDSLIAEQLMIRIDGAGDVTTDLLIAD